MSVITLIRYKTRRNYFPDAQVYVTQEQIVRWLRAGQDVRVTCHVTKNDITSEVLSQIVPSLSLPASRLVEVIRNG
jgi:polyhydroxyalkanoate synthesis regulator protein